MASVELRADVSGVPHTFLVVTDNHGNKRGYGFAPAEGRSLQGAGKVYDDTNHEFSASTGEMPLTDSQYNKLMDYINDSEKKSRSL